MEEIVRNYDVDGIHFDDYFYPTTDSAFDADTYSDYKASGGKLSLGDWRRDNVDQLVREVYSTIKSIDSSVRFGISPQGNTSINYSEQYIDVEECSPIPAMWTISVLRSTMDLKTIPVPLRQRWRSGTV
ncbi:MAG: family 10 glycosylhydrolase [Acutalibacteraceae bacterium]